MRKMLGLVAAGALLCVGTSIGPAHADPAPTTLPGAPTHLAGNGGDGVVNLDWLPPTADGGSAIVSYTVFANDGTAGAVEPFAYNVTTTTFQADGLTNGYQYHFTVAAVNANGTGPKSNRYTRTTAAPPSAPSVSLRVGKQSRTLVATWLPPSEDGGVPVRNYRVYWTTCSKGPQVCSGRSLHFSQRLKVPRHLFRIHNLSPKHRWYVVVRAYNRRYDASLPSSVVSATPRK